MAPHERRRVLSNVAADAEGMEQVVTGLLQLARVQGAPEAVEDIDVESFLRELLSHTREEVTLHVEPGLPPLVMSPHHLETAVRNLLDNALRHAEGKPVTVGARRRGPRTEISVRDQGPGISPANRERIFERFFTTARDAGGTGLGLSIVRAVAETRGGSVEFDSGPDGTEFRLVL